MLVILSKESEDHDKQPVVFDKAGYHDRNIVERLIGWVKECRRIFSRYDKTAKYFLGMIRMAFIQRYRRTEAMEATDTAPTTPARPFTEPARRPGAEQGHYVKP